MGLTAAQDRVHNFFRGFLPEVAMASIQLTDEQSRALEHSCERPPSPVDPRTNTADLDFWLDPELRQASVQTRTWRSRIIRLLRRL